MIFENEYLAVELTERINAENNSEIQFEIKISNKSGNSINRFSISYYSDESLKLFIHNIILD